jgi:hypothetical protein
VRKNNLSAFFLPGLALLLLVSSAGLLTGCSLEQAAESVTPQGGLLFQDDFSNPESGWLQGQDEIGLVEYAKSGLRFLIQTQTSAKVSIPRLQFTDTRVEVTAAKLSGSDDNEFGLVCRYQDQDNFYFFTISSDGYYGIGKYRENQLYLIGMDKMKTSDYINQGEAQNQLRLDCEGPTLKFYVNGQALGQVYDTDFSSGDVGLLAGTFRSENAEVLFDNFSVQKP